MRLKGKCWPVVCLLLFLVSCGQKSKNNTQAVGVAVSTSDSSRIILPEYAEGFEVQYVEGGCRIFICHFTAGRLMTLQDLKYRPVH